MPGSVDGVAVRLRLGPEADEPPPPPPPLLPEVAVGDGVGLGSGASDAEGVSGETVSSGAVLSELLEAVGAGLG